MCRCHVIGVDWQAGSIDDGYYVDTRPCVRASVSHSPDSKKGDVTAVQFGIIINATGST